MSTAPVIRFATSVALVAGLFAGAATPAVAVPETPGALAAKPAPLMKEKCRAPFRKALRRINRDDWAHAYEYYDNRRLAEQAMFDQMRWAVADPQAHHLIPGFEAAAARDRAAYQPVVARLRDDNKRTLNRFESKYLANGCLSKDGIKVFKAGMRAFRASFTDIYRAHEQLFRVNLALQTAQMDKAGQAMQDAELEAETIDENFQHAQDKFSQVKW